MNLFRPLIINLMKAVQSKSNGPFLPSLKVRSEIKMNRKNVEIDARLLANRIALLK